MNHQLIASPYPHGHIVVSPGRNGGIRIGADRYTELKDADPNAPVPSWLADAARSGWRVDVAGLSIGDAVRVRPNVASFNDQVGLGWSGCMTIVWVMLRTGARSGFRRG
ncbi:MAG: hypothetical protein ACRDRH_02615 [Pseudonocardia sp.]